MKISLIKLREIHFPLFYKWWNDPSLRDLTSETDEEMPKEDVNQILSRHLVNPDGFDFIITVDKKPIGHILIQRKKGKPNCEIYIAIAEKKYWNKGIGTIAMNKTCRWFFRNFPKEKLIKLEVLVNNPRAIRCYEKVGFQKIRKIHHKKMSDTWLMIKAK